MEDMYSLVAVAGEHEIVLIPPFSSEKTRATVQRELAEVCRDTPAFLAHVGEAGVARPGKRKVVYLDQLDAGSPLRQLRDRVAEKIKALRCYFDFRHRSDSYHPKIVPADWRTRPKQGTSIRVTAVRFLKHVSDRLPVEELARWELDQA